MSIKFYKTKEPWGELNNFSDFSFKFQTNFWKTSEHFYQASKFKDTPKFNLIKNSKSPREAFNLGNSKDQPLRENWEEIKNNVMKKALRLKFFQNKFLKNLLISTVEEEIIENSPIDSYWGCGPDGTGLNMLGKLLMEVRDELQYKNILYTIGNTFNYEQYFEEQGNPVKVGKAANYTYDSDNKSYMGGCVWKTSQEAQQKIDKEYTINGKPFYSIYGLLANWEKDTYFNSEQNCQLLLNSSLLIKLE